MNFIAIHKKLCVCVPSLTHSLRVWESKRTNKRTKKNMMKNKWWTQRREKNKKKRNLQISNIHSENESKMLISPTLGTDMGCANAQWYVYVCALHAIWLKLSETKTKEIYIINFYVCLLAKIQICCRIEKWNATRPYDGHEWMNVTHQSVLFVSEYSCTTSTNEITCDSFHKRHIDLCLQTITSQTIRGREGERASRIWKKQANESDAHQIIKCCSCRSSMAFQLCLHTCSLPVCSVFVLGPNSRHAFRYIYNMYPEWH